MAGLVDLVRLAGLHADAVATLSDTPEDDDDQDLARDCLDTLFDELAAMRVEDGSGRSILGRFSEYPAFSRRWRATARSRPRRAAPIVASAFSACSRRGCSTSTG
jgi:hypothetical protein